MTAGRSRYVRRACLLLAGIAGVISWAYVGESPSKMARRLGSNCVVEYRSPKWAVRFFGASNSRRREPCFLCAPVTINAESTKFSDDDAERIAGMQSLESVVLNNTEITDAALGHVAKLRNLRQLGVSGTRITDQGLQFLTGMPALERLNLCDTRITDLGVETVSRMPRLKYLGLARTGVTGAALPKVGTMARLEEIDLSGTAVTDNDLRSFRRSLVCTLWLADTQISDAGIAHLRESPRIIGLFLARTQITDDSFQEFSDFPALGWVTVSVTAEGITEPEIQAFSERQSRVRVAVQPDQ